jgi:beta-mannanase
MKPFTPIVAGLVAALLLSLGATTPGLAATPRQIALGVSMNGATDMSVVDGFTAAAGRTPATWSLWSDWGNASSGPFPIDAANGLLARGIVPMIYWEPVGSDTNDCANWSLDTIIKGKHDAYIRQWAEAAKAYGGTIILRFAHENNGYWYIWGNGRCTNTAKKFQKAWQHVWNIFRGKNGVGATNVKFLYSVYGAKYVTADYPGNKYVDYLGLTALSWGPSVNKKWQSLVNAMTPGMKALRQISKTKPIIAAEVGAGYAPNCAKCDKAAWLSQGYPAVYAKWPQIIGIVYFDFDMTGQSQPDWRLESPPTALTAYQNLLKDPRFEGTFPH